VRDRCGLCCVRSDRARDRARRFRLSLGAVVAGDAPDLRLWQRGAAARISAEARDRRIRRLLRPHRARKCGSPIRRSRTFAVVWAKLDGKFCAFVVERGTKGFSTPKSKASRRCAPPSPARSCSRGRRAGGKFSPECQRAGRPVRLPRAKEGR